MRGNVCFQNDNSEMRMARMIHNHTKKTSSVAYVLSFIVSFPEENVWGRSFHRWQNEGNEECMLESKVDRIRGGGSKKSQMRMPVDV